MALTTRALWLVSAFVLVPCVREPRRQIAHGPSRAAVDTRPAIPSVLETIEAGAPEATPPASLAGVIEAVRREDFREARARLERTSEAEQRTREGRYLGGRIALALGDDARAAALLHGLAAEIPALGTEIERLEAQALARAGRHAEARALYERVAARTGAARDHAMAAEQAQAQGDVAAAAAVMRGWWAEAPAGIDRARAWRHAAQALEATGDPQGAARAWKRILVDEPDAPAASEAQAALARLGAPLTLEEILARAANLNERARYAETIAELSALAPGAGASEARRLHLLGRALFYARNRYADAHATLRAASERADNPERDEDAFLAARALARSDRDDEAVTAYDQVARTVRGRWGDEAAFRAAWIVARQNRVELAAERFRAILRERPEARAQLRTEAAWELGWLLYNAARHAEAASALEQSSALATNALERGRGRYWAAMARLRAGEREAAIRGFQAILADRPLTWYALLGETRLRALGIAVPPPAEPAPRRPAPVVPLPENVRWLRALGFDREGGALLASQDDALRARLPRERADEALALMYLDLGETHRAYRLAQRHAELLDHEPTPETRWAWDCAYPRPYAHWVEAAEDRNHLPRHYLFAIMRQESAFNARDVSNARAIGLLQMIPPTTRRVAQELGIEYREELLFEPEYNIRVAGHYIGRLFAQYRGVLPRAIGAFNAGPGAMGRWVARWPSLELDAFVENIPYDETRTYVRRVMQNLARYRYLYGPRGDGGPLRIELGIDAGVDAVVDY
jgi:soluble lytic murein transglycosylase